MKKLIVANWKCNPTTLSEAKELFDSLLKGIGKFPENEVVICPPFIYLSLIEKKQLKKIKLGAQNCFWEEKGAFTGEISVKMLKDLGCEYVIVGHSERRRYFSENDEILNKKLKAVIDFKLKPILCIGENEKERNEGEVLEVLKNQLEKTLFGFSSQQLKDLVLAYEPIWAIGTGKACGVAEAKEAYSFIKKTITQITNFNHSLLYGGSVNSRNAQDFIKKAGFEGLLVGGASLKADEFLSIIKEAA